MDRPLRLFLEEMTLPDTVRKVDDYAATIPHRAGQGAKVLKAFQDATVNVTALDAVSADGKFGALLWVKPDKVDAAGKAAAPAEEVPRGGRDREPVALPARARAAAVRLHGSALIAPCPHRRE